MIVFKFLVIMMLIRVLFKLYNVDLSTSSLLFWSFLLTMLDYAFETELSSEIKKVQKQLEEIKRILGREESE